MKKISILFIVFALIFSASACAHVENKGESTEGESYREGEWPHAVSLNFDPSAYECQVGTLYDGFISAFCFNPDLPCGSKDYNIEIKVEAPDILEVISVDKYAFFSGLGKGLVVRGLKPGTTMLTVTTTYIPTGGSEDTSITVTVKETVEEENDLVADESGDVWSVSFLEGIGPDAYEVQPGQMMDWFEIAFACTECKSKVNHAINCSHKGIGYGYDDYRFDVISENPDILEIVSHNKYTIMNTELTGGITVKGLKKGEARIKLIMTHIATGKTHTDYATVTVVDPATT